MLSRWLTLGLTLPTLAGAFGCQNQGKAMGPNAIEEICGYESEAIERWGCKADTVQCSDATDQKEFFLLKCRGEQKAVASRCASAQQALADCFVKELEGQTDRNAAFSSKFACATTDVTWKFTTSDPTYVPPATAPKCTELGAVYSRDGACAAIDAQTAGTPGSAPTFNCLNTVTNGDVTVGICGPETAALSSCSATPPADAP